MWIVAKGRWIPALLYADDIVLLAEEEEMLREELKMVRGWCRKWAIKVNVRNVIFYTLGREGPSI